MIELPTCQASVRALCVINVMYVDDIAASKDILIVFISCINPRR